MARRKKETRTFRIEDGDFGDAYDYAESLLQRKDIDRETAYETLLVFEALMQKLVDWGLDEETDLDVTGDSKIGDFSIKIGFEGRLFAPYEDGKDSIEDRLLKGHDDKLDYSYFSGYNLISITASRSFRTSLFACLVASLLATLVYIPLAYLISPEAQVTLLNSYIFPIEKLYTNAVLMVGTPMTFFSLLKNLTDTYVVSQRSSGMQSLQLKTLATSVLAIILASAGLIISGVHFAKTQGTDPVFVGHIDRAFSDIVSSLVEPSIFAPFEAILPVPLMVVALLVTYAMCSAGKHFDLLRQSMMACYALFSRMLRLVLAVLPFFCFFAILDVLLDSGTRAFVDIVGYCLMVNVSLLLLFASYAIRLRAHGIQVIPFVRKLVPLLRENVKIGSAINATPYNIRYCSRVYGMDRSLLERNLPVLAQINLDGNCFIIMFFAVAFVFLTGTSVSWLGLIGLGALVVLLSYGAPNQPGSILIGTLIIIMFFNSNELLCVAIYSEAFLGSAQNIVNVIGDIVQAAIEDKEHKDELAAEVQKTEHKDKAEQVVA